MSIIIYISITITFGLRPCFAIDIVNTFTNNNVMSIIIDTVITITISIAFPITINISIATVIPIKIVIAMIIDIATIITKTTT